uniref:Uncharacterized protein n=1 Tax=Macrostomum lignano TaxID=282301 RepID=A0A1I8FPM2_9PLAT
MDDCEEVSAEVCTCVSDLAGWVEPACQSKCLDWLIDRLAARRGPPGWSDAIADRLLAWLLAGIPTLPKAKPLRLFDRSELNICWDSLMLFRRLADRLLTSPSPAIAVTAGCLRRLSDRLAKAATVASAKSVWPDPTRQPSAFNEASQTAARLRLARRLLTALGSGDGGHWDAELQSPYKAYVQCGWD